MEVTPNMPPRRAAAFFRLIRPEQSVKNAFIWLPLFFGHRLSDLHAVVYTALAFVVFSMTAGAVYALNDIRDMEDDRAHPTNSARPLASGELAVQDALAAAGILTLAAFVVSAYFLPMGFLEVLAGYVALNIAYSFYLKHLAIIDVVCVSVGFVLRVFAGGIVADVPVTHWIVIMTFLLAMLLALGKRRDGLLLAAKGHKGRKALEGYNIEFVSYAMVVMTSVVIVGYLLYTTSPEVIKRHGTDNLYLTAIWVVLGVLRYMQIAFVEQRSGEPTGILYKDRFIWAVIGGWLLTFYWLFHTAGY